MLPAESGAAAELDHLPVGAVVGAYVVGELLGTGGFARVYRARQPELGQDVAVKVLSRALALDPQVVQRFIREARAASRIAHPHVVRVLGFGRLDDGRAYQVMELVAGPTLAAHLAACGRLPTEEALRLLDAIAEGLAAAHASGIIHRDLKPANVLLEGGQPRLTDFGIAKALEEPGEQQLTRTGTTLGTPTYMSPEQALGREVGVATDIYSFGVVAYELLAGRVPFDGASMLETMMLHVQAPPPPADPRFDGSLARLLAKHPADRPATIGEAMALLRSAPRGRLARRRRWFAMAAVGAVAVIGGAIAATTSRDAAPTADRGSLAVPAPPATPNPPATSPALRVDTTDAGPPQPPVPTDAAPARPARGTRTDPRRAPRPTEPRGGDALEAPPDYAP